MEKGRNFPILLNIRGTRCVISTALIRKLPQNVISSMFAHSFPKPPPESMLSSRPPIDDQDYVVKGLPEFLRERLDRFISENPGVLEENVMPPLHDFYALEDLDCEESFEKVEEEDIYNKIPYGDFVEINLHRIDEEFFTDVDFDYRYLRFFILYIIENRPWRGMFVVFQGPTENLSTESGPQLDVPVRDRKPRRSIVSFLNGLWRDKSQTLKPPERVRRDSSSSIIPVQRTGPKCILREDLDFYILPTVKVLDRSSNEQSKTLKTSIYKRLKSPFSSISNVFGSSNLISMSDSDVQDNIKPIFKQIKQYCLYSLKSNLQAFHQFSEQSCNQVMQPEKSSSGLKISTVARVSLFDQMADTLKLFTEFDESSQWQFREVDSRLNKVYSTHICNFKTPEQVHKAIELLYSRTPSPKEELQSPLALKPEPLIPSETPPNTPEEPIALPIIRVENTTPDSSTPAVITSVKPVLNSSIVQGFTMKRPFRRTWWEHVTLAIDLNDFDQPASEDPDRSKRSSSSKTNLEGDSKKSKLVYVKVWLRRSWLVEFYSL